MHRRPAGGLAGLGLRGRTGRGTSRTRRAELHERRATAAVRTAKTTAAARSGCEAAQGDHEAQGTAHDWDLHHRRAEEALRSDTMRRPRRRLPNPSSRSGARSDRRLTFSKKFPGRPQAFPRPCRWHATVANALDGPARRPGDSAAVAAGKYVLLLRTVDE